LCEPIDRELGRPAAPGDRSEAWAENRRGRASCRLFVYGVRRGVEQRSSRLGLSARGMQLVRGDDNPASNLMELGGACLNDLTDFVLDAAERVAIGETERHRFDRAPGGHDQRRSDQAADDAHERGTPGRRGIGARTYSRGPRVDLGGGWSGHIGSIQVRLGQQQGGSSRPKASWVL
jgi:hypothetical protein